MNNQSPRRDGFAATTAERQEGFTTDGSEAEGQESALLPNPWPQ
jgi:hypothetical protein